MKNNRDKLVVFVLMIGLIMIVIFGFSIINSVRQTHQQLNNEIQFLHQQVSDLEYNIPEAINRNAEEARSHIQNVNVQYLSADDDNQTVTVAVFVTFKEADAEATYTLRLTESASFEGESQALSYVDGTTYKVTLSLPNSNNYHYTVTEAGTDGSKRLMSTTEHPLPIRDDLMDFRVDLMQYQIGLDQGELTAEFELNVKDYQLDDFGLKRVMMEVWSNEGQVVNQDITDQLTREPSLAMEQYYSGASMSDDTYYYDDTYYEDSIDDQGLSRYYYDGNMHVAVLEEMNLEEIEVFIHVETNDGVFDTVTLHW